MKIKRTVDGRELEFELTGDEIRSAFEEQQAEYDRDDVETYLDCDMEYLLVDFDGLTEEDIREKTPDFTAAYRRAIYNGAFDWWAVVSDVIADALRDEMKEREAASA